MTEEQTATLVKITRDTYLLARESKDLFVKEYDVATGLANLLEDVRGGVSCHYFVEGCDGFNRGVDLLDVRDDEWVCADCEEHGAPPGYR